MGEGMGEGKGMERREWEWGREGMGPPLILIVNRKMVNTILFRVDLVRFRKYLSVPKDCPVLNNVGLGAIKRG